MSDRRDPERETDWLIDWWKSESIDSSPLSSLIFSDLKPHMLLYGSVHWEKSRPPSEDERGGDRDKLTDMLQTVMMTICHRLLTHLTALQRGTQMDARTQPSTLQLGRYELFFGFFKNILAASLWLSRWDRSLLPPSLCCTHAFTSQSAVLPYRRPSVKLPGRGKREITWDKHIMPQWTSHLSLPARISHLLWPSVRQDYMLVGHEAADIPALTQAPPLCLQRPYMHACMIAVMPLMSHKGCFCFVFFERWGGGSKEMFLG